MEKEQLADARDMFMEEKKKKRTKKREQKKGMPRHGAH